jgi:hypothetical protein
LLGNEEDNSLEVKIELLGWDLPVGQHFNTVRKGKSAFK